MGGGKAGGRKGRGGRLLPFLAVLALLAALAFAARYWQGRLLQARAARLHGALSQQFLKVAELTVLRVDYSDCVSIRKSAVAGMSRAYSIVKFTGSIRVGIRDAQLIRVSVSDGGDTVRIVLPRSEILDESVVSQKVFDEKQGLFVSVSAQEVFDEIDGARKEKVSELVAGGILSDADLRIRELMRSFAEGLGAVSVYINLQ